MIEVYCVVEGQGEVEALPVLLRRLAATILHDEMITIPQPWRANPSRIFAGDWREFERAANLARGSKHRAGVLLLLDTDCDPARCPRETGPRLRQRAEAIARPLPAGVVLAHCEFESWFLAAAETLRGTRALPCDLEAPPQPEEIRGAKEWLAKRMPAGQKYRETLDQAPMAATFNLEIARSRSRSFATFWGECERLIHSLAGVA